jgi:hypothetical protein
MREYCGTNLSSCIDTIGRRYMGNADVQKARASKVFGGKNWELSCLIRLSFGISGVKE